MAARAPATTSTFQESTRGRKKWLGMERQTGELRTKQHVPAVSLLGREKTNFYLLSFGQNFVKWPHLASREAGKHSLLAAVLMP